MTSLVIPNPGDEQPADSYSGAGASDAGSGSAPGSGAGRQRRERVIPDADACLDALGRLPGLIALGIVKPAQANAMRAIYHEILQHHQRSQQRDDRQGLSDADVMDVMQRDPQFLNLLEPLLSQEQVELIMRSTQGDDRE
jgi:hypothetical protein